MKNERVNKYIQKISAVAFGLSLFLLRVASASFAQDITLAWDGNQDTGIASYNVYFTEVETQQAWKEPGPTHDPSESVVIHKLFGLDETRQYCFEVTSVSDSGLESPASNTACTTVVGSPVVTDVDGDGFNAISFGGNDCDDNNASINPGALESCTDGVDNNCNGLVDAADHTSLSCPVMSPLSEYFGSYREGAWFIDNNGNGAWDTSSDILYSSFGMDGDLPVLGDWNGDGKTQIGVFRNGSWFLDANGNGAWETGFDIVFSSFGMAGDLPVVGDWNGDGITQIGVFRNGSWFLDANGNGAWDTGVDIVFASFGMVDDLPVVGDWNGDGKTQIGVFRNGSWFLDANGNGAWNSSTDIVYASFGMAGDLPVSGDWNNDGMTQVGVFRNGSWYLDVNGDGAWNQGDDVAYTSFGMAGDLPIGGVRR